MPEQSEYHVHLPEDKGLGKSAGLAESTLDRISELTQHLDHQTNILIGLSSAIFVFAASEFDLADINIPMLIMALASAAAALVGILAVHPPKFMRKRGQKESLLYTKKISSFKNGDQYAAALSEASKNPELTFSQYATEVYNVCRYAYRPKRRLFHAARRLLFTGIALSLLAFLIELAIGYERYSPFK